MINLYKSILENIFIKNLDPYNNHNGLILAPINLILSLKFQGNIIKILKKIIKIIRN